MFLQEVSQHDGVAALEMPSAEQLPAISSQLPPVPHCGAVIVTEPLHTSTHGTTTSQLHQARLKAGGGVLQTGGLAASLPLVEHAGETSDHGGALDSESLQLQL